MGKIFTLEELQRISKIDISELIKEKEAEGWKLINEMHCEGYILRVYQDVEKVRYSIKYIQNKDGNWEPNKLLRICDIIVVM